MSAERVLEFYRAMRELETLVGNVQHELVDQKILLTQGAISSVPINASEAEIVSVLARSDSRPARDMDPQLSDMREATISLIRKAESLLLGTGPDMQRVIVTTEFRILLETVDIIIANLIGEDKLVSRKFGPSLKLVLPQFS